MLTLPGGASFESPRVVAVDATGSPVATSGIAITGGSPFEIDNWN